MWQLTSRQKPLLYCKRIAANPDHVIKGEYMYLSPALVHVEHEVLYVAVLSGCCSMSACCCCWQPQLWATWNKHHWTASGNSGRSHTGENTTAWWVSASVYCLCMKVCSTFPEEIHQQCKFKSTAGFKKYRNTWKGLCKVLTMYLYSKKIFQGWREVETSKAMTIKTHG